MKPPEVGTFKAVRLPEPQTTACRCFGVVDLGTVDNTFPGKEAKRDRKIVIMWELPHLKAVFSEEKGEQPFMLMQELKFSTHVDSNFSKLISAWRNRPLDAQEKLTFDPTQMVNKIGLASFQWKRKAKYRDSNLAPDQITNENTNLVLNSLSPLPKEMKPNMVPMINEPIVWDWDDITEKGLPFNREKFEKIFKFLRTKIYTSDEFKACPTAVNIDAEETGSASVPVSGTTPDQPPQEDVGEDWS